MNRPPMPDDGVIWCERCGKWSRIGQPYEVVSPGKFQHRMCIPRTDAEHASAAAKASGPTRGDAA